MVIKNINNQVYKTQYKKAYSTITRAANAANMELGGNAQCYSDTSYHIEDCHAFWDEFTKKLNVAKKCSNNGYSKGCNPEYAGVDEAYRNYYFSDSTLSEEEIEADIHELGLYGGFKKNSINKDNSVIVLNDGIIILNGMANYPFLAVDINGAKKPNKWGYDFFAFVFTGRTMKPLPYGYSDKGGVTPNNMFLKALGGRT